MGKKKNLMKINNELGKPKKLKDKNSFKKKIKNLLTQNARGDLHYAEDIDVFENFDLFGDDVYADIGNTVENKLVDHELQPNYAHKPKVPKIINSSLVKNVDSPIIIDKLKSKTKKGKVIKSKKTESEEKDFVSTIQSIVSARPSTSKKNPPTAHQSVAAPKDVDLDICKTIKGINVKPINKMKEKNLKHRNFRVNEWQVSSINTCSESKRNLSETTKERSNDVINKSVHQKSAKDCKKKRIEMKGNCVNDTKMKKLRNTINNPVHEEFDPNNSLAAKIFEKILSQDEDSVSNDCASNLPVVVMDHTSDTKAPLCILNLHDYSLKEKSKSVPCAKYSKSIVDVFKQSDEEGSQEAVISTIDTNNSKDSPEDSGFSDRKRDESNTFSEDIEDHNSASDESSLEYDNDDITMLNEALQTSDSETSLNSVNSVVEVTESEVLTNSYELLVLSNKCLLFLKPCTELYILGKLQATLMSGSVEVLGHSLTSDPCEIYSLTSSTVLSFKTSHNTNNIIDKDLCNQINSMEIPNYRKEEMITKVGESAAVLLLKPLENNFTQFIDKHFDDDDVFSTRKMVDGELFNNDARDVLNCSFTMKKCSGIFSIYDSWNKPVSSVLEKKLTVNNADRHNNITMICGGKDAGKSTYLRYLINKLHHKTAVLVIDLDPGQPEFTVCGLVSVTLVEEPLLGPNFTHLKQPERVQCLGFIDITENEIRYLAAVKDLITFCNSNKKYEELPWIINTAGFTQGSGLKNIISIINICNPSFVVEIKSSNVKNNFSFELNPRNIMASEFNTPEFSKHYSHFILKPFITQWNDAGPSLNSYTKPKTKRFMNFLGYMSEMVAPPSFSVLDVIPFVIPLNLIHLAFNAIPVDDEYIPCVINGRAVALCTDTIQNDLKVFRLGDKSLECFGYGIIRGIDAEKKLLYLLTPVAMSTLTKVNVLVYSDCLPDCTSLSVVNLSPSTRLPYTCQVLDGDQNKAFSDIPRRKFNPFRLLEMKNKANLSSQNSV